MKIFRWLPWFHPGLESPVMPVWFHLPMLPACFFNKGSLASIASCVGRLLRIGAATQKLGRMEGAKICVETDISKPIPEEIWIGMGEEGILQPIVPDFVPSWCTSCRKIGHEEKDCNRSQPHSDNPDRGNPNASDPPGGRNPIASGPASSGGRNPNAASSGPTLGPQRRNPTHTTTQDYRQTGRRFPPDPTSSGIETHANHTDLEEAGWSGSGP